MTSWRDVLRERQLAIDAADREELVDKKKIIGSSQESINSHNSYVDISRIALSSSPCTAPAAVRLLATDVPTAHPPVSDILPVDNECNASPELERPTTCSSGVENSFTDVRQAAGDFSDVTEVIQQSSPDYGADLTDELKSAIDFASDGGSLLSFGWIESDELSSSVIDSSKSMTSTPEHLVSSENRNMLNCTAVSPETHVADEVPKPLTETAAPVDVALDLQSPVHKRTRRHGRRHHTKRKQSHAVQQVEAKPTNDETNIKHEAETYSNDCGSASEPSDVQLTSVSEQLELDTFQSQPSDFDVIPDAALTDNVATQVVRHVSYLKAVSIGSENPVTSQLQSIVTESTVEQAAEGHLSSHLPAKTDSKYFYHSYLITCSDIF